jgi:predicted dienelactone hydrolase
LVARNGGVAVLGQAPPEGVVHDARIRAIVVAAPALGFTFSKAGLAAVKIPVQLWRAADDRILPQPLYAEAVNLALPTPPEYRVIDHAGHFDFLAPCSAGLQKLAAPICTSAPGFDRAAFHDDFNRQIVRFFVENLR